MTARIEHWGIVPLYCDPYQPPEAMGQGVHGIVYGSDKFPDESHITTSQIFSLRREEGDQLVITTASGTRYELGQLDPAYERQFPNAIERLWKAWNGSQPKEKQA